jgi:methylmalonyl-CoA/ethylmalonyl-CoA epimerase
LDLKYSHIDILVPDLDRAVNYYGPALGFIPSAKQVWHRDDFHVEYVIMFNENQRFMLVRPISGNLKMLLDEKGPGTIYRFCFTTSDISACFKELVDAGVQPQNENGVPLTVDSLLSPSGTPAIWLPKEVGGLSIEILEENAMEARMKARRAEASV